MEKSYIIRLSEKKDIPEMAELLYSLFDGELEFKPDLDLQIRGLELMFDCPDQIAAFVLVTDDRIAGMVALHFMISTALGGRAAILEDMIIRKEYRHGGLGSTLLSHAIEFARNLGILRITLLTDHTNDPAIRFYQKQGFVRSGMIPMRLIF